MMKKPLKVLISEDEIKSKIKEIGRKLNLLYDGEELTILMVMKGAICFVADLIRQLEIKLVLESIHCSSYGQGGEKRSELKVIGLDTISLKGKNVLIVDDIFDSGQTMSKLVELILDKEAQSVRSLVLLTKDIPRENNYIPNNSLFTIENTFVVGYGLDYKEHYRGLPGIFTMESE